MPLYKENRLNGSEIRALLFGANISGTELWRYASWNQQRNSGGTVELSGDQIVAGVPLPHSIKQGFGRIVDNMLCERWPEFIDTGEICVTIFRMPEKDSLSARRGDYVMVTDMGPHPFRVVD